MFGFNIIDKIIEFSLNIMYNLTVFFKKDGCLMKKKGIVVPVIITIFVVLVIIFYGFVYFNAPIPTALKIVIAIILLFLLGTSIYVLVERIKEIRSGDYDDLSKY